MNVPRAETDALFPAVRRLVAELAALPGSVADGLGVDGLLEEREGLCLYGLARRAAPLGTAVEIGSYRGRSTWFLARAFEDTGSAWPVVAFDPHLEGTQDDFRANLARTGIAARVEAHAAFSHDEAPAFDRPIGLLWIDGDHTYTGVRRDFEDWFPKLVVGGWLAFHDTVNHWHGPTRLVRELLAGRDDLDSVGVMGTITFARKRPPSPANRAAALAGRAAFEAVTLLRARRMGLGPVNAAPGER